MAKPKAKTKVKAKVKAKPKATAQKKSPVKAKAKAVKTPKKAISKAKPATKAKAKPASKSKAAVSKAKPVKKPAALPPQKAVVSTASLRSMASKLRPLDNRVVVQILSREKVTPGGLYIPESATTEGHFEGEVLAVGPGHRDKKGRLRPTQLGVGDKVLFSQWAGDEVELQGHKVRILRESDVLGTLEK